MEIENQPTIFVLKSHCQSKYHFLPNVDSLIIIYFANTCKCDFQHRGRREIHVPIGKCKLVEKA